jgi:hypothetical protein
MHKLNEVERDYMIEKIVDHKGRLGAPGCEYLCKYLNYE